MTTDERFDQVIATWLRETDDPRLPDRVLAAAFDRTRRTRQQLGWREVLARRGMTRFAPVLGGAAVVVLAVVALNVIPLSGVGGRPTPSPSATVEPSLSSRSTTPPRSEAELSALLNGFLEARVAGQGAEQYLNVSGDSFSFPPLLYATTSGAPYERAEFEPVLGIEWPYGWTAFKVRLFAGDTVVEQLVFAPPQERIGLEYQPDGFGTDIPPTTENGQPVAMPYSYFGGEVTLLAAHPWILSQSGLFGRLIPEGPGVPPTTDGGQRHDGWDQLFLIANPVLTGNGCEAAPGSPDAAALAAAIRSYPGAEATAPVAVSVGGADALMLDIVIAAGTAMTVPAADTGDPCPNALLNPLVDQQSVGSSITYGNGVLSGQATGDKLRLYLVSVPNGSSIRLMAVTIVAPETRFERAVSTAAPIVNSIEFHVPVSSPSG